MPTDFVFNPREKFNSLTLFGLELSQVTLVEAADLVIEAARHRVRGYGVTPNVNLITLLPSQSDLKEICNRATFQFADGWPLVWASRRLYPIGLPERVAGSDLFPLICRKAENLGLTIALLGAAPGVAEEAARKLGERYPKIKIVGTFSPTMESKISEQSSAAMIGFCNEHRPDILILGLGIPKQERWIAANIQTLDVGIALCFGAVIDFCAGRQKRAPSWVIRVGMEWFWRFCQNPAQQWERTLLRYPLFFPMFLKEYLAIRFNGR